MNNKIFKNYTNISSSGSYSGISGFNKNTKYPKKDVLNTLQALDAYTLHKPARKKIQRNKIIVGGIDDTWQADLVDVQKLKYQNSHFTFILTCIDVFSKYAWAIPIKSKTAKNTQDAFKTIFQDGRFPKRIFIDGGNEFRGDCKSFLEKQNIQLFVSKTKIKASVVERFNRTLKEKMWRIFTFNKNKKYTNFLPDLIKSYNNSYHRSIKTKPTDVKKENESEIFRNLYGYNKNDGPEEYIKFKFKKGDYVRISVEKDLFDKGYTGNWSKEIYIIHSKIPSIPVRYKIKSLEGEEIDYLFYEPELQKVSFYPYDTFEVLQKQNNKILVKKLNSETQQEEWVDKSFIDE